MQAVFTFMYAHVHSLTQGPVGRAPFMCVLRTWSWAHTCMICCGKGCATAMSEASRYTIYTHFEYYKHIIRTTRTTVRHSLCLLHRLDAQRSPHAIPKLHALHANEHYKHNIGTTRKALTTHTTGTRRRRYDVAALCRCAHFLFQQFAMLLARDAKVLRVAYNDGMQEAVRTALYA
jgi:hypothetical protein